MANEPLTLEDFCAKIESEGGIIDALDYGLRAADLDTEDDPRAQDLKDVWETLESAWDVLSRLEIEADEIISQVLDAIDEEE